MKSQGDLALDGPTASRGVRCHRPDRWFSEKRMGDQKTMPDESQKNVSGNVMEVQTAHILLFSACLLFPINVHLADSMSEGRSSDTGQRP
jgi:hypothetical protein